MFSEKIKGKYEIILGFVTLIISLSAFKTELDALNLDLGYYQVSLGVYFLYTILGFCICLYFYVLEYIVRDTKIGKWKIFDVMLHLAYYIFSLILVVPILLCANIFAVWILKQSFVMPKWSFQSWKAISDTSMTIIIFLTAIIAKLLSNLIISMVKNNVKKQIEIDEIKDLERARKLLDEGYYSHSILDSFKVLENFLYKQLINRRFRVRKYNVPEMIQTARSENVISEEDLTKIEMLRKIRNINAHSNTKSSFQEAKDAFDFVSELLIKSDKL